MGKKITENTHPCLFPEDFQSRANKAICEVCGCPTEAVTVIIQDVPKTKWGREENPAARKQNYPLFFLSSSRTDIACIPYRYP
jgi:hypothetical protein